MAREEERMRIPDHRFTRLELEVMLDGLNAALAGDPSEPGDFSWNAKQCDAAISARTKLMAVLSSRQPAQETS